MDGQATEAGKGTATIARKDTATTAGKAGKAQPIQQLWFEDSWMYDCLIRVWLKSDNDIKQARIKSQEDMNFEGIWCTVSLDPWCP